MPYQEHPAFAPPPSNVVIWRYMDLAKYVSMLANRALFFSSADRLGDPFEGSYPRANIPVRRRNQLGSPDSIFLTLERQRRLRMTLINSWYMNEVESAAMWDLYARAGAGIAIRSSYESIVTALAATPRPIHIGVVKYLRYDDEPIDEANFFTPFLHKRASFAHERELRAVTATKQYVERTGPPTLWPETSENIPADLPSLVHAVHLSPRSAAWFAEVVRAVTETFGFQFQIQSSSMIEKPFY